MKAGPPAHAICRRRGRISSNVPRRLRPLTVKLPDVAESGPTGGSLASLLHTDYPARGRLYLPRRRRSAERKYSTLDAVFPGVQARFPNHLFQLAMEVEEIGAVTCRTFMVRGVLLKAALCPSAQAQGKSRFRDRAIPRYL